MSCCDNEPNNNQGQSKLARLVSDRRLWLVAAVAVGAGLLFGWEQLVIFGIAPILISLLPCLIMCGLGVCMMGKKKKSDSKTASETEVPVKPVATASAKTSSVEF